MVSEPLAMPDVLKPKTQTVWEVFTIDVGVAEPIVAAPPEIESAKSPTSRLPEPPVVLKTSSLKVTVSSEFAELIVVPVIVGSPACAMLAKKHAKNAKNICKNLNIIW
jgi:hypothetical protein